MDFLKRHYEKIVLAAALVALIASAVYLAMRVNGVSSEEPTARISTRVTPMPHIDLAAYSNAIQSLAEPPLWTNTVVQLFVSLTTGSSPLPPPPPEPTNDHRVVEPQFPVTLLSVVRKPFKLLFMAYSPQGDTGGYNFQINFQFRPRTFFVHAVGDDIKDQYEDTGYRIINFEKKSIRVNDPAFGGFRDKDVSELTVQHETDTPVVLILNKESEDQESVAEVRCTADGSTGEYRRGQELTCPKGTTYKVIDIDSRLKQMVIVDTQTQEQHTIKSQQ